MDATWLEFLRGTPTPEHAAHVYVEIDELAASVAGYLSSGFADGEPAVVIASSGHWELFAETIAGCGWDVDKLEAQGLLVRADADATLATFMDGTNPDPQLFEESVGGLVAEVAERFPDTTIRAFGEMVNVLCERNQPAAASALEDLWNGLATRHRFSLLCGYQQSNEALAEACRSHTRVLA